MTYHVTPNIFVPTAESYARNALATLPYARKCCGHYSHGIQVPQTYNETCPNKFLKHVSEKLIFLRHYMPQNLFLTHSF